MERAIRQAKSFESRVAQEGGRAVIVFEIEPGPASFGAARDLAQAITELSAQTVAYIPKDGKGNPQKLTGHAVLVALACEQIAMSKEAQLGEAGLDDNVIAASKLATYEEIANARRNVPAAIAQGMLDPALQIWEIETVTGRKYATAEQAEQIENEEEAIRAESPTIQRGEYGLFTGDVGFQAGFVQHLVEDRNGLAMALSLPVMAMEEDISLASGLRAVKVTLEEPLTPRFIGQVERSIQRAIDEKDANLIILIVNSSGGAPDASKTLANYIAKLPTNERRTVAFVRRQAKGDAAFIAMACNHLLMAPDAKLGGEIPGLSSEELRIKLEELKGISRATGRPHSVMAAMIDGSVTVYEYQHQLDGRLAAFGVSDWAALPNPDVWRQGNPITEDNLPLVLDAENAYRLGIATELVGSFPELRALYGLDTEPESIQPTWLDTLVSALTQEGVMWALLLIGGSAFFIEMQSPGTGIGGFVACICFLLFFWGNYLDGTAGWLEVLLFVAGLIFLLLEVFVIPGVGIFGVGGGILIVASLVMAMQSIKGDFTDGAQLDELTRSLFIVASAGVGTVTVFALVRRYLPKSSRFGSLVLNPPEADTQVQQERESVAVYSHLVGETGTAATSLRPSGKVLIQGQMYDVVTDGVAVEKGDEIVIAKVQGSRIVVRPVRNA
ncbi:MAG: hypothetical protein MPJ50_10610 [Pirellulales bacterium]|nr:hypothetical protein [Pirellulales bacterium]